MENILKDASTEVPNLVILLVIVVYFLKHLTNRDKRSAQMTEECHKVQREGHEIMRDCCEKLGEVTVCIQKMNGKH